MSVAPEHPSPPAFTEELSRLGVEARSPWDLVKLRTPYPSGVIAVLLDWLNRAEREVDADQRETFQEGLVRALSVPEARGVAGPRLVEEFERPGLSDAHRWAVGSALKAVATPELTTDLIRLAADRRYGAARQMVVLALGRTHDPAAIEPLIALRDDPTVDGHALTALRRLRASEARPYLDPFLEDKRAWVRVQARRFLAQIDAERP